MFISEIIKFNSESFIFRTHIVNRRWEIKVRTEKFMIIYIKIEMYKNVFK